MPRIQNVSERMKEAPAHALRTVFAGIGQALLLSDRMRRKFKGPHDPEDHEASDAARIPVSRPTAVKPTASAQVTPIAEAASVRSATKAAAASATRTAAAQARANPAATATPTVEKPTAKAAEAPAEPAATATPTATATPAAAPPAAAQQATPQAAQPPITDYDELSLASLRARLRGLDLAQVGQLLSYEKSHGSRSEVITMYERRIAKLREVDG